MIPVDSQTMREVAPSFGGEWAERQAAIIAATGEVLRPTLEAYQITTRLRIAHFLAQTCHESAGFRITEEFADGEAYEGRADLGNTRDGDGPRYKGRGLLMLTGRVNYRENGKALQADLEGNPSLAAEPVLSLRVACEYWRRHAINAACDQDDLLTVTRLVNGGLNGLPDRRAFAARAKTALARIEGFQLSGGPPPPQARLVLGRGSQGEEVASLQTLLRKLGFAVAVDGDFGPGTEVAVARFQSDQRLEADGIAGAQTWTALLSAQAST